MTRARLSLVAAVALLAAACGGDGNGDATPTSGGTSPTTAGPTAAAPTAPSGSPPTLTVEPIASGFTRPTFVTNAGDGSSRLFVVEKPGTIEILRDGTPLGTPFLDITARVRSSGNEQGLLGLAFHPDFVENGRFFVAYTALDAANSVAEFHVDPATPDRADPNSGRVLLAVSDQYPNHNGGMLAFGPDGYLYISMGDGGSAGDPNGNGQKLSSLLGKILRVDVDSGSPYGIPESNPFVGTAGARGEIWAYGLRNPWRLSFDRTTGDLWVGDVGQNKYEEIDFQAADSDGGENYGWNVMEGNHCYKPAQGCPEANLVKPVFEYDHAKGCSVTGGYVYRGSAIPALAGRYLFADYCSITLRVTTRDSGGRFTTAEAGRVPNGISAFGEDEAGELYIAVDSAGAVYRIVAR